MEKKDLLELTDEELLLEKKKLKKSKIIHATIIGFLAGILIFGVVSWTLSSEKQLGFLIPMLIPIVFIYRLLKTPNNNKDLEAVLKERKVFDLDSGTHTIYGKIDWCRSPVFELNIEDTESREIEIRGFKYANIIMPVGLGSMVLFFFLSILYKTDLEFLFVGGGLGFLYILYFMTLGRNNYLSIQENL